MRQIRWTGAFTFIAAALMALPPAPASAQSNTYCGPVDVAFVIDDTATMSASLNDLKNRLAATNGVLDQLEQLTDPQTGLGSNYRLALVTFKDFVHVRVNFSRENRLEFMAAINQLTASLGEGTADASDEALNTVVNTLPASARPQGKQIGDFTQAFRDVEHGNIAVRKIIVLITDAPPGGFDGAYTIRIVSMWPPSQTAFGEVINILDDYATTTGGYFTRLDEPSPPFDPTKLIFPVDVINWYFSSCSAVNRPPIAGCYAGPVYANAGPGCSAVPVSIEARYPGDSWDWEDGDIPPTKVQSPAGPCAVGTTLVTLTVTDSAGATDSCQADVVVTCNALPIVSVPPPITAEATGPDGAVVSFTVTATDATGTTPWRRTARLRAARPLPWA
jgi:hypothetical protein